MARINSKVKGRNGEAELAEKLREYGYSARRGQQFAGGFDSPDVVGLPGIHIECKRQERLNIDNAMDQAIRDSEGKAVPAVFHRRNRRPWMVTLLLDDFMKIYKEGNDDYTGR